MDKSKQIENILKEKCIIALDIQNDERLKQILIQIKPHFKWVKVGLELFYSKGPQILDDLNTLGFNIFLDLKLYDIPQTIYNATCALTNYPFNLLTIHLSGGANMIEKSISALKDNNHKGKILGVSVLTSFSEEEWGSTLSFPMKINNSIEKLITQKNCENLYGVVCSGQEIKLIKDKSSFKTVVPGIRWNNLHHDQARIITPFRALSDGADYLVIGREITATSNLEYSIQRLKDHLYELL